MGEIWLERFYFFVSFWKLFSTATEWDKFQKNVQFRGTKSEINVFQWSETEIHNIFNSRLLREFCNIDD